MSTTMSYDGHSDGRRDGYGVESDYDEDLEGIRAAYGARYARYAHGDEDEDEYGYDGYSHADSDEGKSEDSDEDDGGLEEFTRGFPQGRFDEEAEAALKGADRVNDDSLPADWEDVKAAAVERLKSELRGHSSGVDVGLLRSFTILARNLGGGPWPDRILPHDDSLNAYWDDFVKCLQRCDRVGFFSIRQIELNNEVFGKIAAGLKGRHTGDSLFFQRNALSSESIVALAHLIEGNGRMRHFNLCSNPINDLNAAGILSRAWKSMGNLQEVSLHRCNLGDKTEMLSTILSSGVQKIDLALNNIGSSGARVIADCIRNNSPASTKELWLWGNAFSDHDAKAFACALKKNTSLHRINLFHNRFSVDGAKSLLGGFFDTSSLNAISQSNHTCTLLLFSALSRLQRLLNRMNPEYSRREKILIALHENESLLQYLAEIPLEVMPAVLGFIQGESNGKRRLTMMYAIFRWWEMPSLYSYCNASAKTSSKRKRET